MNRSTVIIVGAILVAMMLHSMFLSQMAPNAVVSIGKDDKNRGLLVNEDKHNGTTVQLEQEILSQKQEIASLTLQLSTFRKEKSETIASMKSQIIKELQEKQQKEVQKQQAEPVREIPSDNKDLAKHSDDIVLLKSQLKNLHRQLGETQRQLQQALSLHNATPQQGRPNNDSKYERRNNINATRLEQRLTQLKLLEEQIKQHQDKEAATEREEAQDKKRAASKPASAKASTQDPIVIKRKNIARQSEEDHSASVWPQQDDTVREAIRKAHRIEVDQTPTNSKGTHYLHNGTQCESPPRGLATVVTAYYDLSSKHPREQYEGWIRNILKATDPMIIFVDPTSNYHNWWPFIEKHRHHAPTLLVALPFRNLTMSTVFTDQFWKTYILPRDRTKRFKKGVDVYKIWNEKIILMNEVARENPFDTEFFYWIDAGYFRGKNKGPQFSPIVRNNITHSSGIQPHQVVYHMVHEEPTYEIAGGAWGGTRNAILNNYKHYWETFWYLTLYSDKECVGFEQRVQVWMCRSFPHICVVNYSDNWFAMGNRWLRDPTFDFMDRAIRIPKDKTTSLPLVDSGKVNFPTDPVIDLLEEIPKGARSLERLMNYTHVILPEEKGK